MCMASVVLKLSLITGRTLQIKLSSLNAIIGSFSSGDRLLLIRDTEVSDVVP